MNSQTKNLIICVGPSASGKSHFYNNLPNKIARNAIQVNRDILRKEYQEIVQNLNIPLEQDRPIWDNWKWKNENIITEHQDMKFISALTDVTVKNIYWTDTNLNYDRLQSKISELIQVSERRNITLHIKYQFFLEAEETLIKRDNARSQGVGSSVIHRQMNQFYQNLPKFFKHMNPENTKFVKGFGKNPMEHLYELNQYLSITHSEEDKTCVIVDIDGTIASMKNRKPYDWDKVYNDDVIREHEKIIESYVKDNYIDKIIFLTGRDGSAYEDTLRWLNRKSVLSMFEFELYSRAEGDTRKDYLVKQELFLEHCSEYNVRAVFDDRPQVLRMWLNLGLKVYPMQNPYLDF